jgi:hypothetical protein
MTRAELTTFIPSPTDFSFLGFLSALLNILGLRNDNLDNNWLAFRDEIPLAARQLGEQRQFEPLHCRFNSSQMMSANGNFVRRENQLEVLLVAATG